jgi:hypothetical protein
MAQPQPHPPIAPTEHHGVSSDFGRELFRVASRLFAANMIVTIKALLRGVQPFELR